jgi:Alternative complex III, ActD subunit
MSHQSSATSELYALLAEFESPEKLLEATRAIYAEGYRWMEAYTPFPVDGVAEALGPRSNRVPPIVFGGGLIGGLTGYFMQWFSAVVHYPINVGGRPLHSWPAFIPITFEMTVLGAALAAVVGMLALNGLPRPYHPVFNVPDFVLASSNRFFLSIQTRDPRFDRESTYLMLERFEPRRIHEVPY